MMSLFIFQLGMQKSFLNEGFWCYNTSIETQKVIQMINFTTMTMQDSSLVMRTEQGKILAVCQTGMIKDKYVIHLDGCMDTVTASTEEECSEVVAQYFFGE